MDNIFKTLIVLAGLALLAVVSLAGCKTTSELIGPVVKTVQQSTDATLVVAESVFCDITLSIAASRKYGNSDRMNAYITICSTVNQEEPDG